MKKQRIFRVLMAIAVMLTVSSFSADAQGLKGIANKAKKAVTATQEESSSGSTTERPAAAGPIRKVEVPKADLPKTTFKGEDSMPPQPWEIASERSLDTGVGRLKDRIVKGSVTATFEDGVLSISGPGLMDDFGDTRPRPWGAIKEQIVKVVLSPEVYNIGAHAFAGCMNLKEIVFSKEIDELGPGAYASCTSLETFTIPKSVTKSIRESANKVGSFQNCTALKEFKVEEGSEDFAAVDGVLYNKRKNNLLVFPPAKGGEYTVLEGVTTIADKVFAHCHHLTDVTLPASVTGIRKTAFYGCDNLRTVTILNPGPQPISMYKESFIDIDMDNLTIYVPADLVDIYKTNDRHDWRHFPNSIKSK